MLVAVPHLERKKNKNEIKKLTKEEKSNK